MRASLVLLAALVVTAACGSEQQQAAPVAASAGALEDAPRVGPPADVAPRARSPLEGFRLRGSMLVTSGATYESTVSAAGALEITPRRALLAEGSAALGPFVAARSAPLALETIAITRGERVFEIRGAAFAEPDGAVAIRRGDVLERIENEGTGIEQSWSFARAPGGAGDLVVRIRATGETYRTATDHGLHFEGDALGLRYGTATWIDARGTRTVIRPRFEGGIIELVVPDRVVSSAEFPAVLDPTITPEREIDVPAAVTSAPGEQYYPAVATVGTGGGYFAAWYDGRSIRPAFFGARITSAGIVTDETGVAIASGVSAAQPALFSSGNGFLLLWTVQFYDVRQDPGLYAVRVDASGKPLDAAPIVIVSNVTNLGGATAAFDGSNWLVTWSRYAGGTGNDIAGVRLSAAGAVLDATPLAIASSKASESAPIAAFDGTDFMVTFRASTGILGQKVGKDGKAIGGPVTLVPSTDYVYDHALAFDGTRYLVAYSAYNTATGGYSLRTRRFDKQGAATDGGAPLVVSGADTTYADRPRASFDGTNFLVTWMKSGTVAGARVAPAGGLVDATPATLVKPTPNYAYEASVASDGPGGMIVYRESATAGTIGGSDVRASKVTAGASLSGGAPFTVSKAANSETDPSTAWNGTTHLTVWLDTREAQTTIWGVPIATDGTPGKVVKLLPNPNGAVTYQQLSAPRIASNGSTFFVTFSGFEVSTGRRGVFGMVVDAQGVVQGGVKDVAVPPVGPIVVGRSPDVAFDGGGYLVVYEEQSNDGTGIAGRRIKADGTPLDDKVLRISPLTPGQERRTTPSIAFDGQRFFVAWATTRPTAGGSLQVSHIYGSRVEREGNPVDGEIVVCNAFLLQRAPRVAGDTKNGGFFAVWEDYRTSLDTADVYGGRISAEGRMLDGDKGLPISVGDSDASRPAVASSGDGTNWVVAWRDLRSKQAYDVFGAWVSSAGKNRDPQGLLLSAEGGDEETPAITASAPGKFLLTYARLDPRAGYGSYRLRARAIDAGRQVGEPCENGDECASRACADGFCCATDCDGCGTCSVTAGTCTPRPANTDSPRCDYKCTGTLECPTECLSNEECRSGTTCDTATKTCVTRQICIDDDTLQDVTGKQTKCAPYKCVGDACRSSCGSVDDCAPGFVCDQGGRCVPPPNAGDTGGCSLSRGEGRGSFAAFAVVFASMLVRRRRR